MDIKNIRELTNDEREKLNQGDWNIYKANPNKGEKLAFREFIEKSKWKFEEFLTYGWMGKSFVAYKD